MIGGLFGPDSSDSDDGEREGVAAESDESIELAGTPVVVRACAYHPQNANKVWPGTYSFASWLAERWDALPLGDGQRVLELGAATGALSAWLAMRGCSVASSDIDDGDVARLRRGCDLQTGRGGAAAATWKFRGDESRRRRGRDVNSSRRPVAPPRPRRGNSAETNRGGAAAAT